MGHPVATTGFIAFIDNYMDETIMCLVETMNIRTGACICVTGKHRAGINEKLDTTDTIAPIIVSSTTGLMEQFFMNIKVTRIKNDKFE